VSGLEAARLVGAEEIVRVHQHDPLRAHAGFLEDLVEVLHRPHPEERARREIAIDVLRLLRALLHRLRHVRGDRIGGGDVDEERYATLLRHRHDRRRVAGVERAHQDLCPGVDEPLGLGAGDLGLGLGVAEHQLELRALHRLDTAGRVHVIDGDLRREAAGLARLRERTGHAVDRRDLDRLRLRAQRQRHGGHGGAGDGGLEKRATARMRHATTLPCNRYADYTRV
jgi:hypothetical protein